MNRSARHFANQQWRHEMKKTRLTIGWILVGVPLVYGVVQTLIKVAALFG